MYLFLFFLFFFCYFVTNITSHCIFKQTHRIQNRETNKFTWQCLWQWLVRQKTCRVCQGSVTTDKVTPIYGKGKQPTKNNNDNDNNKNNKNHSSQQNNDNNFN